MIIKNTMPAFMDKLKEVCANDPRMTTKEKYNYRLKSTGESSQKYGVCEVCRTYVSEVFLQVEMREYGNSITFADCRPHTFGHQSCLQSIQKRGHNASK